MSVGKHHKSVFLYGAKSTIHVGTGSTVCIGTGMPVSTVRYGPV